MRLCLTLGGMLERAGGTWATKCHAPYEWAVHGGLRPLLLGLKILQRDVGLPADAHLDIPGGIRGDLGCPDWERWGVLLGWTLL